MLTGLHAVGPWARTIVEIGSGEGNFLALLEKVDLSSATTLCDVGGANGTFCGLAVQRHAHLSATVALPDCFPIGNSLRIYRTLPVSI